MYHEQLPLQFKYWKHNAQMSLKPVTFFHLYFVHMLYHSAINAINNYALCRFWFVLHC